MLDSTLLAEVTQAVRQAGKIKPAVIITAESRLVEDLNLDSLDLVGAIMKIEDRFGLEIDVDEVPNFQRISDIVAYVSNLLRAEAA